MIIHLNKSKLFTTPPAQRFADEYHVSEKIWNEVWKRYAILDYTTPELCEFYYIKVGKPIKTEVLNRWLLRTKIFSIANSKMKDGAKVVNSNIFGDIEGKVIAEILRHIKNGEACASDVVA